MHRRRLALYLVWLGASLQSPDDSAGAGPRAECSDGAARPCSLVPTGCRVGRQSCSGGQWAQCALEPPDSHPCSTRCPSSGELTGESLFANVSRRAALRSDWAPLDLAPVPGPYRHGDAPQRMRLGALGNLVRMLKDARDQAGTVVLCASPYRSFPEQCGVFARNAALMGCEKANVSSATAGHSEHQLGTACDLVTADGAMLKGDGPADVWLSRHASAYGFLMSYPEGTTGATGYRTEPWHLRYVGRRLAALHDHFERNLGRKLSTEELLSSIACWPQAEFDELGKEDPPQDDEAGRALCDAYRGLSNCQSATTLIDCESGVARLRTCPHRCVVTLRGTSDVCR